MAAYAKWRHEHGIYYCIDCGELIKRSMHHYKCTKCWNDSKTKERMKKAERGYVI
jgi:DNA-directed RNA polymerase subunit RPC12/RpoP